MKLMDIRQTGLAQNRLLAVRAVQIISKFKIKNMSKKMFDIAKDAFDAPKNNRLIADEFGQWGSVELPKDYINFKKIGVIDNDGKVTELRFAKPKNKPKVKLSKTQKELVLYMRQGYAMMKNVTYVLVEMRLERTSVATFFALYKKELIKSKGRFLQGRGQIYELSKLGKTAELV
jgi:hypothetical protein